MQEQIKQKMTDFKWTVLIVKLWLKISTSMIFKKKATQQFSWFTKGYDLGKIHTRVMCLVE
jgi:hypothetical protein